MLLYELSKAAYAQFVKHRALAGKVFTSPAALKPLLFAAAVVLAPVFIAAATASAAWAVFDTAKATRKAAISHAFLCSWSGALLLLAVRVLLRVIAAAVVLWLRFACEQSHDDLHDGDSEEDQPARMPKAKKKAKVKV